MKTNGMTTNDHGLWCDACGEHLATAEQLDDAEFWAPEQCTRCGWPDEFDPVRSGFADDLEDQGDED